ncbi:hypothetical protein LTR62_003823 [Meristemomyces frigidus]|uniref:Uncharacterized protein n=1 Tax=Meristemomyces frigidus TaxID=1508187 RepID=A0AAN7TJC1_9PEZI|nr:hypothetical protein LTR62_003823 [Meristemomyces frigidus]
MGSISTNDNSSDYSVPAEASKILHAGILKNPLLPSLPKELHTATQHLHFTGATLPSLPLNWRFAESISALKAFEACMLNVLRKRKYSVPFSKVELNTDHATLFVMSPFLTQVVVDGEERALEVSDPKVMGGYGFPGTDLHDCVGWSRLSATNIYQTKDESTYPSRVFRLSLYLTSSAKPLKADSPPRRYYHVHGSMNPDPTLTALGLPLHGSPEATYDEAVQAVQDVVSQHNAAELDELMNEQYKQAGTIAWTPEEFQKSEHGKANAHVGLYELSRVGNDQPAAWWPDHPSLPSSPSRPLAGLKVVDLTRVIAAPTITRNLAEMGASVMRVTAEHLTDLSLVHQDLNWGKWTSYLDLKTDKGRAALRELIKDADVVVEGYRPGSMERNGFGRDVVVDLVKDRGRGIIHVRENCYGWNGPWKHRSGWQQISDACCGVSMRYGQAMGHQEAVTPIFPNSDYCTGVAGSAAVLHALIRRAEDGGSYGIDVALNYYSQWLVQSVGEYPEEVWQEVWKRHGSPVYRNYHSMNYTLPSMMALLAKHDKDTLFNPDFFEHRTSKAVGHTFVQVKPVARFADDVQLCYNVGTRSNGVDQARWPEDLRTEVVS